MLPDVGDVRARFVVGWFDDTLQSFEAPEHNRLLIKIDSGLYSSAVIVLSWARPHIQIGDFVYFDEFADRLNEVRAFIEFLVAFGQQVEILAASRRMMHILLRRTA